MSDTAPDDLALPFDTDDVLDEIERRLRTQVASSSRFVGEAARYLMDAGGKRFRPLLVVLTAHLGDDQAGDDPRIADAGVIVELIHLATLYHDDVIDEAAARRGAVSANTRWDNTVAILTGDFIFARASELSADLGVEVTRLVSRTIATLCEGQIRDVQGSKGVLPEDLPRVTADADHYLTVISEKTASLVATSCRLGALLSGCDTEQVEAAADYGWNLGMAFQLSDDVLDIAGDPEESGKPAGTDLRQGLWTMPVLYALEDDPDGELARLLRTPEIDEAGVKRALQLLRASPALRRARGLAGDYAEAAVAHLDVYAGGPAVRALSDIADYTVTRTA